LDSIPSGAAPVIPKQGVKTNVFSTGSSATPTIARAPSQVQTGGFGDPNGIPAKANQGKAVNIAALGSFRSSLRTGLWQRHRRRQGRAGRGRKFGFGNGTATPGQPPARRNHGSIQRLRQRRCSRAAHRALSRRRSRPEPVPAEILSKPTPIYTQEARSLRIEGEVLLEVVLEASGSLRVVRVVRGLGHGLDDNAVKAAEQIHFKPAMRDGQPTDSTVVLHIIFQLA
jgi:TonB family protein